MVMGEESLEAYDAMMTELKNQGLDQVAKIYNAAYERYKAAQA